MKKKTIVKEKAVRKPVANVPRGKAKKRQAKKAFLKKKRSSTRPAKPLRFKPGSVSSDSMLQRPAGFKIHPQDYLYPDGVILTAVIKPKKIKK